MSHDPVKFTKMSVLEWGAGKRLMAKVLIFNALGACVLSGKVIAIHLASRVIP
jgi:hypothetical protein